MCNKKLSEAVTLIRRCWDEKCPSDFCDCINTAINSDVVVLVTASEWEEYQALKGLYQSEEKKAEVAAVFHRLFDE